jgi:DnaJ like chaperone protein
MDIEAFILIVFIVFSLYYSITASKHIEEEERKKGIPNLDEALAALIAVIMNADGQATRSELAEVKYFLLRKFGERKAKKILLILKQILDREILNIRPHCLRLNRSLSYDQRVDFITLLFRIANTNNGICENEAEILQRIARHTTIQDSDLNKLRLEYASSYHQRHTTNKTSTVSSFKWAYQTLSVRDNATQEEIKKAYRKLAMQYHPDRMDRNDVNAQQAAAEKFRTINEAYKILKKEKQLA